MAPLKKLLHISLLVLICASKVSNTEAEALVGWKSTLVGANSLSSWSTTNSTCSWFGVSCDAAGHVTELSLPNAGLNGTLDYLYSAAFLNLTKIKLNNNNFVGAIPANISKLLTLTYLDLSSNNLAGAIPYQLSNLPMIARFNLANNHLTNLENSKSSPMSSLKMLSLANNDLSAGCENQLHGGLPPSFARIQTLLVFLMPRNNINGTIPTEMFTNCTKLEYFDVSRNLFTGSSPSHISKCKKLEVFVVSRNFLTGSIPSHISECKELVYFDVSENLLTGSIPVGIGSMRKLQALFLSKNHVAGNMPSDIGNATSLQFLDVGSNHLQGELPKTISLLVNLVALDLSGNKFTGIISNHGSRQLPVVKVANSTDSSSFSGESRSVFCGLTLLQLLDLSNNELFGDLPGCLWNLKDLQTLDLSGNAFDGEVPSSTFYNSSLRSLHLSSNNFTGCFLVVLKNFKYLVVLDLGDNKISDVIPPWIGEISPSLRILSLRSNMFYGSIPSQLTQLPHLQLLDLAENKLVGSIPESFVDFSLMRHTFVMQPSVTIDIPKWYFYNGSMAIIWKGREYTFKGRHAFVTGIDLSGNSLSGEIPSGLTSLRGMQLLNMSRNNLTGYIPKDIGNLNLLESLDLSWNKLSGPIPPSVSNLMFLTTLNLNNNLLSGEIPTGSQLQTLEDPSIYGNNLGLCGPPLSTPCTKNSSSTTPPVDGDHEHEAVWMYYSVIAGTVLGFWVWFGALFFCKIWRFAFFNCIDAMQRMVVHKMERT
ncbi:hypothetical protein ZWY2020_000041 [Hordeum vulgare]|nr:hypothetical protein ZWY2020_000041 [Hordeum vulgare]